MNKPFSHLLNSTLKMSFYQGDIAFVVHCSKFERKCFCGQTADKLTPDSSHSFGQVCILLVVLLAQR